MGSRTKIDWCDATWNPVTGCLHGCEYCYARGIATRFAGFWPEENPDDYSFRRGGTLVELDGPQARIQKNGKVVPAPYPFGFTPTLHKYKLDDPQFWKKPRTIFVCSMADLFGSWVPDEWIAEVFNACTAAPQHRYLFLTKNPERYKDICLKDALPYGPGFWYGTTTTRPTEGAFIVEQEKKFYHTFLSIEPIQERFGQYALNRNSIMLTDWVIIGAETGNRKDKVTPEKEWIDEIAEVCKKYEKPIFMKESLREIMGADFVQEFPWEKVTLDD